jgi:hypothetical protein
MLEKFVARFSRGDGEWFRNSGAALETCPSMLRRALVDRYDHQIKASLLYDWSSEKNTSRGI